MENEKMWLQLNQFPKKVFISDFKCGLFTFSLMIPLKFGFGNICHLLLLYHIGSSYGSNESYGNGE